MPTTFHQLLTKTSSQSPENIALQRKELQLSYQALKQKVDNAARGLVSHDLGPDERVSIYLPKQFEAVNSLKYFTNSDQAMPGATLSQLMSVLPDTVPYLMYGLTEAFRNTYLHPEELTNSPESVCKAIPNAEILVI